MSVAVVTVHLTSLLIVNTHTLWCGLQSDLVTRIASCSSMPLLVLLSGAIMDSFD